MSLDRPVTSKPRGICRYYNKAPRSCLAGHSCKFLHGEAEKLTPFEKSKVCKYYAAGFCRRGAGCWFLHQDPVPSASTQQDGSLQERSLEEEDNFCCICYDKPVTYGLLGWEVVLTLPRRRCIREWRDPDGKSNDIVSSGNTKRCPFCRVKSRFVTPSSHFYPEGHPGKLAIIEQYKASMARVPCRYFQKSPSSKRFCPFGKDCFYQHQNEDGTPYVFTLGVDHYMEVGFVALCYIHQRRPRRGWIDLNELESLSDFGPSAQLDLDDLDSIRLRLPMLFESMSLYDDFSPSNGQWQDSPNIADDASEGNATSLQTVLRMADRLIEDITDHVGERSQTFYHFGAADLIEGGSAASAQLPETTESIAGDVLVPSESVSNDSMASSTFRELPSSAGVIPPSRFSTIVPGHERLIADDVSPSNELDLMRSLPDGPDVSSAVSDAILAGGTPSGAAEARSLADKPSVMKRRW
ncbi:E3 ubiquitin-protein ligase makorin-1 [Grifola frondosa]|uniref:E3 ubiquitin-protein ligase makorin-1 n=1 Tax=Grifola frondosa TaxID=5627 RepID=A0A1C7MAC3_GRIFR|nr:E3 ubiquitin-protein ligase makorin-1 [Grifola frondosa]